MDSDADVLRLTRKYLDHWERGEQAEVMTMFAETIQYHDIPAGVVIGYDELEHHLIETRALDSKAHFSFHEIHQPAKGVAFVHWTLNLDAEHSDRTAQIGGVEMITFANSKIAAVHEFYDYQDLGETVSAPAPSLSKADQMKKLGLDDRLSAEIANTINVYFANQKPYLDPDVNLVSVSDRLGYTRNQISFVMNHFMDCNFYDYVNRHRIEFVSERMKAPDCRASVVKLAIESGFNSISGFYKAFKKHTGLTPSVYRKRLPDTLEGQLASAVAPPMANGSLRTRADDAQL